MTIEEIYSNYITYKHARIHEDKYHYVVEMVEAKTHNTFTELFPKDKFTEAQERAKEWTKNEII